jgi:hypothetical protein
VRRTGSCYGVGRTGSSLRTTGRGRGSGRGPARTRRRRRTRWRPRPAARAGADRRDGGHRAVQAGGGGDVGGEGRPPQQHADQTERDALGDVADPPDRLDERLPAVGGGGQVDVLHEAAGQPAHQRVQPDGDHPGGDGEDQRRSARDLQRLAGELPEALVGLVLQAEGEQQRGRAEHGVDGGLGQALRADERRPDDVLRVEQPVPPPQHLAALPQRQREHAQPDQPEQHRAAGRTGDRLQRAGLVGVGAGAAAGELHRQPADQQVQDAVGDQPHPGDRLEQGVVGDLAGVLDQPVDPAPLQ